MNSSRLEAFSDGVLAIIITIMVLELKVPEEAVILRHLDLLFQSSFLISSALYMLDYIGIITIIYFMPKIQVVNATLARMQNE